MKLTKPDSAALNRVYHRLIGRTTRNVPNYCMGEDRPAVYDRVKALGIGDLQVQLIGEPDPKTGWLILCLQLPDRPWKGYGITLLEAWVYLLLIESGVEIER